jgi:hypothetical protein
VCNVKDLLHIHFIFWGEGSDKAIFPSRNEAMNDQLQCPFLRRMQIWNPVSGWIRTVSGV